MRERITEQGSYETERSSSDPSENKKNKFLSQVLPSVNTIATLFWALIMGNPFGLLARIILLNFEQIILMALTLKLTMASSIHLLSDEYIFRTIIDSSSGETLITLSIVFVAIYSSILLIMVLLFSSFKGEDVREKITNSAQSAVGLKIVQFFFGCYQEVFGLFSQIFIVLSFEWLQYYKYHLNSDNLLENSPSQQLLTTNFTSNQILLIVLISILQVQLALFSLIERIFFNLEFKNGSLINSRTSESLLDFFQPVFQVLVITLSLKVDSSRAEKIAFQSCIFGISLISLILYSTSMKAKYFDPSLQKVDNFLQMITTSFYACGLSLYVIKEQQKNSEAIQMRQFIATWLIMFVLLFGFTTLLRQRRDERAIQVLKEYIKQTGQNKNSKKAEFAIYYLIECMDSNNPSIQMIFLSSILNNEELIETQSEVSYYDVISRLVGSDDQTNEEVEVENSEVQQDDEAHFYQSSEKRKMPSRTKNPKIGTTTILTQQQITNASSKYIQDDEDPRQLLYIGQPQKSAPLRINLIKEVNTFGFAQRTEPEGMNQQLLDLFQNDFSKSNNFKARVSKERGIFEKTLKLLHIEPSQVESDEDAIQLVKTRFLFNVILQKLIHVFPQSLKLMFCKALISIDRLNNKYLALTMITHINIYSKRKLGYIQQIQTKIQENYFMNQIDLQNPQNHQKVSGAPTNKDEKMCNWVENEKIVDPNLLLEQNLEIDYVLNNVQICCKRISEFWQLYNSDELSIIQFNKFLSLSEKTAEVLQKIKVLALKLDNSDNYHSKSFQLCFVLSQFYSSVLRDSRQAIKIVKHIDAMNNLSKKISVKENPIDDLGVMLVDGNFDLYGKIRFGNKIILELLGYTADDVAGQLIHKMMPRNIAEIHNQFWKNFAVVGEPKILDKVIYLFVKDSSGYISPFKIFVKFMNTIKFGYSFVGLFKQPSTILMTTVDIPLPLRDTYLLICNQKGQIIELSRSCRDLFHLTPDLIEKIHSQLEEGLNISLFNQTDLMFNEFDFDQNSCFYIKSVVLDFNKLQSYIDSTEINENEVEETKKGKEKRIMNASLLSNPQMMFRVQMKIIKEIYGVGALKEPINVFYVIFSEAVSEEQLSGIFLSAKPEGLDSFICTRDSAAQKVAKVFRNFNSEIGEFTSKEFVESMSSQLKGNQGMDQQDSNSVQSFKTGSECSSMAAEGAINAIDEEIDDDRTPSSLICLRIVITLLVVLQVVLSSVQFYMNNNYIVKNINFQTFMYQSVQCQEFISELALMSRTYVNINLGLEPENSTYVSQRGEKIRELALDLIQQFEGNIKELNTFYGRQDLKSSLDQNVMAYTLYPNSTVEVRHLPWFYIARLWTVNLLEIFSYRTFKSKIGTFLESFQSDQITSADYPAFFIFANSFQVLQQYFKEMIVDEFSMISDQVDQGIFLNKMFVIAPTILILLSTSAVVYLTITVLSFKHQILKFFEMLSKDQVEILEHAANKFVEFLKTGDTQMIVQEQQLKMQVIFKEKVFIDDRNEGQIERRITFTSKKKQIIIEELSDDDQQQQIEQEAVQAIQENVEEYTKPQKSNLNKQQKSKQSKNPQKNMAQLFDIEEGESTMASSDAMKGSDSLNNKNFDNNDHIVQRKVSKHLDQRQKQETMRILPAAIFITAGLILYFVIQYLLFKSQYLLIQDNSYKLASMLESLECQDTLFYDIRNMQVSNNTKYELDPTYNLISLSKSKKENIETSKFNETFGRCLRNNQIISDWLQAAFDGEFYLGGENAMCNLFETEITQEPSFTKAICEEVNQGALQKTPLQATSLALQDLMHQAIRFLSHETPKSSTFLMSLISAMPQIDLLDSHIFFQMNAIRRYYHKVTTKIIDSQKADTSIIAFFGAFVGILLLLAIVVRYIIFGKIRRWFWSSLFLLHLLPRDDMNQEFIKNINELLRKA